MKGVIFTEFLQLVEEKFGYQQVDEIIQKSELSNDGAYTAVGTYDHRELLRLVTQLSRSTSIPVPELVKTFGGYLFGKLAEGYPSMLKQVTNSNQLLSNVHGFIHVEVRKLYPDAELPDVEHQVLDGDRLEMTYHSSRPFADLAEGLIAACTKYFGEAVEIQRKDLGSRDGTRARFVLTYKDGMPTL